MTYNLGRREYCASRHGSVAAGEPFFNSQKLFSIPVVIAQLFLKIAFLGVNFLMKPSPKIYFQGRLEIHHCRCPIFSDDGIAALVLINSKYPF